MPILLRKDTQNASTPNGVTASCVSRKINRSSDNRAVISRGTGLSVAFGSIPLLSQILGRNPTSNFVFSVNLMPTMVDEPGPHGVLAIDRLPSRPRISTLCRALRRRLSAARIFLLGPVLMPGVCPVHLPRESARHRGMSAGFTRQAVPHGHPWQNLSFDIGGCERKT